MVPPFRSLAVLIGPSSFTMYVVLNHCDPAASWQMLATTFMSTPCARAKITARPGAVPASSSPARYAWKRSGFAWKRICFSWYFFPWLGARSGRALISHTCSSAAKPRPKRIGVGSCASAAAAHTSAAAAKSVRFIGHSSDVIRIELFPVYQPGSQRHERPIEGEAEERDHHHQRQHAIGLERRERIGDEIAQAVDRADHLGDDGDDQRHRQRYAQRGEDVRQRRRQHHAREGARARGAHVLRRPEEHAMHAARAVVGDDRHRTEALKEEERDLRQTAQA